MGIINNKSFRSGDIVTFEWKNKYTGKDIVTTRRIARVSEDHIKQDVSGKSSGHFFIGL